MKRGVEMRFFKTQYDERQRRRSDPGDPIKIIYSGRYDENGRVVLEETGKVNLYEEIQSHADSVNINMILKRFTEGDTSALSRVQGFYGDLTQMPTNLAESLNQIKIAEETFNALPVEERAKFDHNLGQFLASIGTPEFFAALGIDTQQAEPIKPDVVEKEVSKE